MPVKKDDHTGGNGFEPTFSDDSKPEQGKSKDRIYWAKATGLSIANWRKEQRVGNAIVQPEASLNFNNHIKITGDPEMIEFIESSNAFESGRVKRVATLAEAQKLTAQVSQLRQIQELSSSAVEVSPTIGRR